MKQTTQTSTTTLFFENKEAKKKVYLSELNELCSRHRVTEMDYKSTSERFETQSFICTKIRDAIVLAPPFMTDVINMNDERHYMSQMYGNGITRPLKMGFYRGGDILFDPNVENGKYEFTSEEIEAMKKCGKIAKYDQHYYLPISVDGEAYLLHLTSGSKNALSDPYGLMRYKRTFLPGKRVEFRNGKGYSPLAISSDDGTRVDNPKDHLEIRKKFRDFIIERNEFHRSKLQELGETAIKKLSDQILLEKNREEDSLEEFSFDFGVMPTGTRAEFEKRGLDESSADREVLLKVIQEVEEQNIQKGIQKHRYFTK